MKQNWKSCVEVVRFLYIFDHITPNFKKGQKNNCIVYIQLNWHKNELNLPQFY